MKTHQIPNIIFYKHLEETMLTAHELPSRLLASIEDASLKIYTMNSLSQQSFRDRYLRLDL